MQFTMRLKSKSGLAPLGVVKGSAPIQMMKKGLSNVAREGKAGAGLAGRDTACAEGAADFGCLVGGGGEVMTAKEPRSAPDCSPIV